MNSTILVLPCYVLTLKKLVPSTPPVISAGRFAAEDIKGHVKRGELITPEIAEAIAADEKPDGVKIMSALSSTNVRGVSEILRS